MTKDILSRRRLLQKAAVTASAVGVLGALADDAVARTQSSQQVAGYQNRPNGSQHCGICVYFVAPASCKSVAGRISPQGWCKLFYAKSG
jgi:hypothetical protein